MTCVLILKKTYFGTGRNTQKDVSHSALLLGGKRKEADECDRGSP